MDQGPSKGLHDVSLMSHDRRLSGRPRLCSDCGLCDSWLRPQMAETCLFVRNRMEEIEQRLHGRPPQPGRRDALRHLPGAGDPAHAPPGGRRPVDRHGHHPGRPAAGARRGGGGDPHRHQPGHPLPAAAGPGPHPGGGARLRRQQAQPLAQPGPAGPGARGRHPPPGRRRHRLPGPDPAPGARRNSGSSGWTSSASRAATTSPTRTSSSSSTPSPARPETVVHYEFMQDFSLWLRHEDGHRERVNYIDFPMDKLQGIFPSACLSCFDYPNALSDITIGYMGAPLGWQWVLARTARGVGTAGPAAPGPGSPARHPRPATAPAACPASSRCSPSAPPSRPSSIRQLIAFLQRHRGPRGPGVRPRHHRDEAPAQLHLCARQVSPDWRPRSCPITSTSPSRLIRRSTLPCSAGRRGRGRFLDRAGTSPAPRASRSTCGLNARHSPFFRTRVRRNA